jgi:hypothetical protein
MAFGADATGTYDTKNFLTPQGGIEDHSTDTLLRVAGSATEQGYGITAAVKGRAFRGEIDTAVKSEIGKEIAGNLQAQPPDTQEFKDAIERAKQVTTQGGIGARMRANLLAEKLTREKAGANPMFASVYKQVAQEVLGNYDATLQFMDVAEASALEKAKTSVATAADMSKKTLEMAATAKISLPVHPSQMTPEENQQAQLYILSKIQQRQEVEDTRKARAEVLAETKAQASIQASAASITASSVAVEAARGKEIERKYATKVADSEFSDIDYLIQSSVIGPLTKGQPVDQANWNNTVFLLRHKFEKAISDVSPELKAGMRSDFEARMKGATDLFTGSFSEGQVAARQLSDLTANLGIAATKAAPTLAAVKAAGGPGAAGALVESAMSFNSQTKKDITTEVTNVQDVVKNLVNGSNNRGDVSNLSAEDRTNVRGLGLIFAGSQNPQTRDVNPDFYGGTIASALYDIERGGLLEGREMKSIVDGLQTNNFTSKYPQMDPSLQQTLATRLHAAAEQIGEAYAKKLKDKFLDEGSAGVNPQNGYFILPDKQLESRLNNFLDSLVISKSGDRSSPNNDIQARLYFLDKYFGYVIPQQKEQ